jgi:hypothetical protein
MTAEWLRAAAALRSPVSTMQAVIGMAMETGPWTGGSITVLEPRSTMRTFAYLDARADGCDRLQEETGEGPAYDAVRVGLAPAATNLAVEQRWPRWSPGALRLGIHRALTVRLFTNRTWGTLNLYATRPGRIDSSTARHAEMIAAHASVLLAAIITEDQLGQAVSIRGFVGQAQGILMHTYGINADAAFAVLRRTSQDHNTKIVTIAEHLLATGTMPSRTDAGTGKRSPEPPAIQNHG